MSLQEAIKFLKGAVARNLPGKAPSIYVFHEGWAYAQDSAITAAYPVPHLLGTFALAAEGVDAALSRFASEPTVGAGDGSITLKSGRTRSALKLMYADPPALTVPEDGWQPLPKGMITAFRMVLPFISEQGTWQRGARIKGNTISGFSNKSVIEIEVEDLDMCEVDNDVLDIGNHVVLGNDCLTYITSLSDEPTDFNLVRGALYFRWASGANLRCQLLSTDWPDAVDNIQTQVGEDAPVVIDDNWRQAFADAAALGEGNVEVTSEGLISRTMHATNEIDLSTGVTVTTRWMLDALEPVMKLATSWNPEAIDRRARFYGPGLRGVVVGLRA
jgi:hypothetical protein